MYKGERNLTSLISPEPIDIIQMKGSGLSHLNQSGGRFRDLFNVKEPIECTQNEFNDEQFREKGGGDNQVENNNEEVQNFDHEIIRKGENISQSKNISTKNKRKLTKQEKLIENNEIEIIKQKKEGMIYFFDIYCFNINF